MTSSAQHYRDESNYHAAYFQIELNELSSKQCPPPGSRLKATTYDDMSLTVTHGMHNSVTRDAYPIVFQTSILSLCVDDVIRKQSAQLQCVIELLSQNSSL